jgi:hypothetical protein
MLNCKDGTHAGRCMSNRLQMYRVRLYIAAEVRGLLRILFIRFCTVPADSSRKASPKLSSYFPAWPEFGSEQIRVAAAEAGVRTSR